MEYETLQCEHASSIVDYLYNEMPGNERMYFENHLSDCASCIDEFASMSEARFGVYEWHKDEFLPLATPTIIIPDLDKAHSWSGDLVAKVRAALHPAVASPSFAFGALLLAAIVGFAAWSVASRYTTEKEVNTVRSTVPTPVTENKPESLLPNTEFATDRKVDEIVSERSQGTVVKVSLARQNDKRASSPVRRRTSRPLPSLEARKNLTVDDNVRDEDNSLRLSDLFDEEGT